MNRRSKGRYAREDTPVKGKIKIYFDLCKGCSYCVDACPMGVISMRARFNKNGFFPAVAEHMEKCTGCAMCAHMCPEIAIRVYRETKR